MLIRELFNTNEAISVSSYDKPIEQVIKKTISGTLSELTELYGYYKAAESDFNDYNGSSWEFMNVMTMEYEQRLLMVLGSNITDAINRQIGNDVVEKVHFKKLDWSAGRAPGRGIEVSKEFLKTIATLVIEKLISMTINDYDREDYSKGFFLLCKEAAKGDPYIVETINQTIYETVYKLVDVIIHELTHVLQHYPQLVKGRKNTEYRSYLDRKKGEFAKLRRSEFGNPERSERWWNLYYASPQEMAAFAHNAASYIIRSYDMHRATDPSDLYDMTHDDIIHGIRVILGKFQMSKYFDNPKTAKEQQIRNRYIKLVYTEVQNYINKKRESLKKTA